MTDTATIPAPPSWSPGGSGESSAAILRDVSGRADQATLAAGPKNEANGANSPDQNRNPLPHLVRDLFIRAREARRALIPQWKLNYRSLNNRNYRPSAAPWDEEPAVNQVWPVIASMVSWMTDQRPTFRTTPTAEAFSEYWDFYDALSRDLNTIIASSYTNYNIEMEMSKMLWDTHTYGIGYIKTQWEPWLADGLGDMVPRRVDPFTIYPDPFASDLSTLTYIIEAKTMTVADAERSWPGAAKLLSHAAYTDDMEQAPTRIDESTNPTQPRVVMGSITGPGLPSNSPGHTAPYPNGANKLNESPVISVLECYIRGFKTEDADTEGVVKVKDDWRCIVITGNTVLVDKPCSEIYPFNTHPYDRNVLFDTGEWYGPCMVEMLAPMQRQINWLLGAISRNIYLMGNPILIEAPNAASRNSRLTNRPGQRFSGIPGQTVGWMNPPQMHPQLSMEMVAFLKGEIEAISGLSAMIRGFAPGGRNAQGVLDSIQDAAFVRIRASLREMEKTMRGSAMKMAAGISEFYTEPRLMSIIGPDGRQTSLALQARHFYARDEEDAGTIIPLRFSITADAGSSMPTSKQARAAEAKHLFELGAIDILDLLRAMEWPNYADVAARVMEQQLLAAQQGAQS